MKLEIDLEFEPLLPQTKDYRIDITAYLLSTQH